jgi:hypothetical protein
MASWASGMVAHGTNWARLSSTHAGSHAGMRSMRRCAGGTAALDHGRVALRRWPLRHGNVVSSGGNPGSVEAMVSGTRTSLESSA